MLKDIQTKFKAAVMQDTKEAFLLEIEEGGKIGPEQRLHIYAHAYKSRLVDTLVEDFPVLHSLVGDDMFEDICLGYIDKYPSSHPSLRYFGQHMVQFLKETEAYSNIIPAIEMADFEWNFNDVFDAPDARSVSVEEVAKIPAQAWTTLRIHLQPSFVMSRYKWNTPAVWSTVSDKNDDHPIMPEEYPKISNCIQWKSDLKCFFRTVPDDEAALLNLAKDHKSFPDLCEQLLEEYGEAASMRAAELFKGWIMEGLVCDLEYLKV
ncbi:MAG: putative DNA-binding domain-containing protein [Alphaproteobacteria bacterium]|nr:putative DNA-binding domain-containing protein [Alphaproteobacteria bacterium]HPF47169.1 DNA-binding domain-containing protein [Emcibacteraceae bacterium]HRW29868.1 DNA-binding domain-containing protein [Emcibacteraceae bacterium]